jgi:hypothetical protein
VLEYNPSAARKRFSSEQPFVLALFELDGSQLKLRVRPDWAQRISPDDRIYIDELLKDWKARSTVDPRELFEQVLSLNVGPLTAREFAPGATGDSLSELEQSFKAI